MIKSLTNQMVLFLNGDSAISKEFEKQIKKYNIPLYRKGIVSIAYSKSEISKVYLNGGHLWK